MEFDQRRSRHEEKPGTSPSEGTAGKRTLVESLPVQQRASEVGGTGDVHAAAEHGLRGSAQSLPHLDVIQQAFGKHDVSGVQAFVGGPAAEASRDMGAQAYATGNATAFASAPDLHTAAHEAAHVVQQRGGVQLQGGVGATGDRYEQHADAVADLVTQGRSAEPLLDQGISRGSATGGAQSAVQRLSQPIVSPAPASAIGIRQFIQMVQAEEARWPVAERTQTALMISRLRKIFYGSPGWDQHLIPGAAGVAPGYNINQQEDRRENLPLPGFDREIVRSHQTVTDSSGATPAIASQQEVRLEDGSFCDIGHVFAGLDAHNHPASITVGLGPANVVNVTDNVGATTWTGDLGSVLAECFFARQQRGHLLSDAEGQAIVNEYASPQDMLGNIDVYAMASAFNTSNAGGRLVSDLLSEFYLGAATTAGGGARVHRYSRFCASIGLTGWTGSGFANEAAWLDRWPPEVAGAAALYIGATTEGGLQTVPALAGMVLGIQQNPMARLLVQNFLNALKPLVSAEPP
jgi:Domain of unknown function (DUF4157)